jgi:hypothetical protein
MTRSGTDTRIQRAVQRSLVSNLLAVTFLVLVGCTGLTQTPFQRTAIQTAGTLAAAAETLTAVQEGRLTEGYARASFVSFAEAVHGVGEALSREEGAPATENTDHLGRDLREVEVLLRTPCLRGPGCDPSAQIRQLKTVSEDLLQASAS